MNNSHSLTYKNTGQEPYTGKTCCRCGINGGTKKYSFVFRYSYRAKMCYPCIEALGGSANALEWINLCATFGKSGELYFPQPAKPAGADNK